MVLLPREVLVLQWKLDQEQSHGCVQRDYDCHHVRQVRRHVEHHERALDQ